MKKIRGSNAKLLTGLFEATLYWMSWRFDVILSDFFYMEDETITEAHMHCTCPYRWSLDLVRVPTEHKRKTHSDPDRNILEDALARGVRDRRRGEDVGNRKELLPLSRRLIMCSRASGF